VTEHRGSLPQIRDRPAARWSPSGPADRQRPTNAISPNGYMTLAEKVPAQGRANDTVAPTAQSLPDTGGLLIDINRRNTRGLKPSMAVSS